MFCALPLRPILVTAFALIGLGGCGQKGALYIPQTEAAAQRASLPQTIYGSPQPAASAPGANAP